MKTEHKQALQWMLDGKEIQVNYDNWTTCSEEGLLRHIANDSGAEFRLKPRTITVNGREVQEGEVGLPQEDYFVADPVEIDLCTEKTGGMWYTNTQMMIDRGLVHLTKEAAIAHAKAMLNID